jgi:hypothetical protein
MPNNGKGSRIKATWDRDSVFIPYPSEFSGEDAHRVAAEAVRAKCALGQKNADKIPAFTAPLIGGCIESGRYVFVVKF